VTSFGQNVQSFNSFYFHSFDSYFFLIFLINAP